jgi:Ca2+/Na+ antiporter
MKNVSSLLFLILLFLFLVSSGNEPTSIPDTTETETPAAETEDFNDVETSAKDIESDAEMMQIILGS